MRLEITLPADMAGWLIDYEPRVSEEYAKENPNYADPEQKILTILRLHLSPEPDLFDDLAPF